MPFDFKLSLSVFSARKSRKGALLMGEWAERAFQKSQGTSSKRRLDEELELLRHHKTVAGAETIWAHLVHFDTCNASIGKDSFNKRHASATFIIRDLFVSDFESGPLYHFPLRQAKRLTDLQ
jgi:hypothetical protein